MSEAQRRLHSFLNYAADLNPQQRAVVQAEPGPVLVIAGAGSGKTRTVTYRVAYLIESGVNPANVLLVTFTNKAAREMLHRVELLVPGPIGSGGKVWGGTFHHIANRLLRRHALLLGFHPNFTILDQEDSKNLMQSCVSDSKINTQGGRFPKADVLEDLVGLSVNTRRSIEDLLGERYPFFLGVVNDIRAVAEQYRVRKQKLNVMDFDDLLFYWEVLLREHPEIRERYGQQFQHILVDEYQDTNQIQAEIIDLLASRHQNVMVVGDDAQSIYSFRGANFANILSFPERYPAARIFKLEFNYRSTPPILRLANSSIGHNREQFPKELKTVRQGGSLPLLVPARDTMDQAAFVANRVEELRTEGVPLSHIAVLYRAHYHSMEMQMELTRRGIPYEMRSGLRFFEQAHIKDVSAYLKIVCNPLDELAWKRVLKFLPGIGKATADKIWKHLSTGNSNPVLAVDAREVLEKIPRKAREYWTGLGRMLAELRRPQMTADPGGMIEHILEGGYEVYLHSRYPDYLSRSDDLRQLAAFGRQYSSCQEFLSELALLTAMEGEESPRAVTEGNLTLSSVHQAKGLEWPVVFIIWLAEGRFPSLRSLAESSGEEEERRLFYVAVTRARDQLYLCYPRFAADRGGKGMFQRSSRFIAELHGEGYAHPDFNGPAAISPEEF